MKGGARESEETLTLRKLRIALCPVCKCPYQKDRLRRHIYNSHHLKYKSKEEIKASEEFIYACLCGETLDGTVDRKTAQQFARQHTHILNERMEGENVSKLKYIIQQHVPRSSLKVSSTLTGQDRQLSPTARRTTSLRPPQPMNTDLDADDSLEALIRPSPADHRALATPDPSHAMLQAVVKSMVDDRARVDAPPDPTHTVHQIQEEWNRLPPDVLAMAANEIDMSPLSLENIQPTLSHVTFDNYPGPVNDHNSYVQAMSNTVGNPEVDQQESRGVGTPLQQHSVGVGTPQQPMDAHPVEERMFYPVNSPVIDNSHEYIIQLNNLKNSAIVQLLNDSIRLHERHLNARKRILHVLEDAFNQHIHEPNRTDGNGDYLDETLESMRDLLTQKEEFIAHLTNQNADVHARYMNLVNAM